MGEALCELHDSAQESLSGGLGCSRHSILEC